MARLSPNISVKMKSGILQLFFTFRTYAVKEVGQKVYRDFYARIPLLTEIEKPKDVWSVAKKDFKNTFLSSPDGIALKEELDIEIANYKTLCKEFISKNGEPPKGIKELEAFGESRVKKATTLTEVFDQMLSIRDYSKSEKSKISITRDLVKSFEEQYQTIDVEFLSAARNNKHVIQHFCGELYKKNSTLSVNTVRDKLEKITTVCNHAVDDGILSSNQVITIKYPSDFKRTRSGDEELSLQYTDILKIIQYKSPNKQTKLAKNLFLINVFSGVRYGDISKLFQESNRKETPSGNVFYYITQDKTRGKAPIPALFADLVISKLPKRYTVPSNNSINEYYEDLIKQVLPNKTVHINHTRIIKKGDNFIVKEVAEKVLAHKVFTSKNCRKTNLLFNLSMGLTEATADVLLGHKPNYSGSHSNYTPEDLISVQILIDKVYDMYIGSEHYEEITNELRK